jgi:hypothetical protein
LQSKQTVEQLVIIVPHDVSEVLLRVGTAKHRLNILLLSCVSGKLTIGDGAMAQLAFNLLGNTLGQRKAVSIGYLPDLRAPTSVLNCLSSPDANQKVVLHQALQSIIDCLFR